MPESKKSSAQQVVVIGAGVTGIASAYELARRGFDVTLVDRDEPAAGCSYGNAGMTWCPWVAPMARRSVVRRVPGLLLNKRSPLRLRRSGSLSTLRWMRRALRAARPERVEAVSAALRELAQHAQQAHDAFAAAAGCEHLIEKRGWLEVYRDRSAWELDDEERSIQNAAGMAPSLIEGDELRDRAPALSNRFTAASFHGDVCHTINPRALALEWFREFRNHGGQFVKQVVHDIVFDRDKRPVIINEGKPLSADHAVIALGAWSNSLVTRIDGPVPLAAMRGYHAMLPSPNVSLEMPIVFKSEGFVATPMQDGLRIAGTDEFASLTAPPAYSVATRLLRQASTNLPGLNTGDAELWMGARPALPDSLPVISRSITSDRIVYAFGHHHLGLMLAPLTGQLVSDIVDRSPSPLDITPFRVQRLWSL